MKIYILTWMYNNVWVTILLIICIRFACPLSMLKAFSVWEKMCKFFGCDITITNGTWSHVQWRLDMPLVMVIWLVHHGRFWWCSELNLPTICWIKSHLRSEVWASCTWRISNTAIGMPKPNSRCSALPSVAEVHKMEGCIFNYKQKL